MAWKVRCLLAHRLHVDYHQIQYRNKTIFIKLKHCTLPINFSETNIVLTLKSTYKYKSHKKATHRTWQLGLLKDVKWILWNIIFLPSLDICFYQSKWEHKQNTSRHSPPPFFFLLIISSDNLIIPIWSLPI